MSNINKNNDDRMPNELIIGIELFFYLANINLSTWLRKLSKQNMFFRWVYLFLPFTFLALNTLLMSSNDVLFGTGTGLYYLSDISNSICLTILFFISFYISGFYPEAFEKTLRIASSGNPVRNKIDDMSLRLKDNRKEKTTFLIILGSIILLGTGVWAGALFWSFGGNHGVIWIDQLVKNQNKFGLYFYSVYLGFTWYFSICLLGMVMLAGIIIYSIIKNDILKYEDDLFNKNPSIIKIYDLLVFNFSFGLFYIGGAILFIVNDVFAKKIYGVQSLFSNPTYAIILLIVVFILVVAAYIPLHDLKGYMERKKEIRLQKIQESYYNKQLNESEKRSIEKYMQETILGSSVLTTIANKMILTVSFLTPIVGIIVQCIKN